jgi:hypothetical protein
LLFHSNSLADKDLILQVIESNFHIPIKILISESNPFNFPSSLLATVKTIKDFYPEFFSAMGTIEKNLKRIFNEIDSDQDELIDKHELIAGLNKLGFQMTIKEINDLLVNAEFNQDGKMNYGNFSYWWKRGRQGGKSLRKITENFKKILNKLLPEHLPCVSVNKEKSRKNIRISFGQKKEGNLGISLLIGTSAKREEILRPVNNFLSLFMYETWVVFKVQFKKESLLKFTLPRIEELMNTLKYTLLASVSSGSEMESGIITKVAHFASDVYLCVVFDVQNDLVQEFLGFTEKIEKIFKSPTDDFVDIKLTSTQKLNHVDLNHSLFESLENGSVFISSEHWGMFNSIIRTESIFFRKFLETQGDVRVDDPKVDLKSFKHYAMFFINPLKSFSSLSPTAESLFKSFNEEIIPEFSLYLRHNNLGLYFSITDPSLQDIFNNPLINNA